MRDIKFRAFIPRDNKMLFVGAIVTNQAGIKYIELVGNISKLYTTYSEKTNRIQKDYMLMQYTGSKDKNGIEIYEGDILKSELSRYTSEVVFEPTLGYGTRLKDGMWNGKILAWLNNNCKIIGNIYENPELLK